MSDGTSMAAGVPQGASRINPDGSPVEGSPALPVPTNVPLVVPANNGTKYEPNSGALELARTLGNINFGALANQFQQRASLKKQANDEAEQAKGQAETALILSRTGQDYDTLVKAGKIPLYKSPSAQLGSGIAAAQNTFAQLREAAMKRGIDNPNAVPFIEDSDFMSQFYGKLNGVRNEAVVKYFMEPAQQLAADDTKRQEAAYNSQFKMKILSDTTEAFTSGIRMGDEPGPALNNALNKLKLSNSLTPESAKSLISSAGGEILSAATDKSTGQINLATVSRMVSALGDTKLSVFAGNKLGTVFPDQLKELRSYVYGTATQTAQAQNEQYTAQQNAASLQFTQYVLGASKQSGDGTYVLPTNTDMVKKAISLGLDVSKVPTLTAPWASMSGNMSHSEESLLSFKADQIHILDNMTPAQRENYYNSLPDMMDKGKLQPGELDVLLKLKSQYDQKEAASPITSVGMSRLTSTLADRMHILWDGNGYSHVINGSTFWKPTEVPKKVAQRLSGMAVTWAEKSPLWGQYLAAKQNDTTDPESSNRVLDQIADQFLLSNKDALRSGITKAVVRNANPDPVRDLNSIRLGEPQPTTQAPQAAPKPSTPKVKAAPQEAPHIPTVTKQAAKARTEVTNPSSGFYGWVSTNLRAKYPMYTTAQVQLIIKNLKPSTIQRLQQKYESEHATGGAGR